MCRASHRTRDAGIIEAHIVSRPDLVRIDQDGYPSEIATLIRRRRREPYPLPGQVLQFAPGNSVEIYLGAIQVISGVILTRQVRRAAALRSAWRNPEANQHLDQAV